MNPYDTLLSNAQKAEMALVREELERMAAAARQSTDTAAGRPADMPQEVR